MAQLYVRSRRPSYGSRPTSPSEQKSRSKFFLTVLYDTHLARPRFQLQLPNVLKVDHGQEAVLVEYAPGRRVIYAAGTGVFVFAKRVSWSLRYSTVHWISRAMREFFDECSTMEAGSFGLWRSFSTMDGQNREGWASNAPSAREAVAVVIVRNDGRQFRRSPNPSRPLDTRDSLYPGIPRARRPEPSRASLTELQRRQ